MATATTQPTVRLPYPPTVQEQFQVDVNTWKVLAEAIWPDAKNPESIVLALSYCKARNLDPLKKVVHIVPVYSKSQHKYVDTIWPSIAELRITATRTGTYAGRDATVFGPDVTKEFTGKPDDDDDNGKKGQPTTIKLTFPEWAQVTVYKIVANQRVPFVGPQVYWEETVSTKRSGMPTSMWVKRPRGQLDKCATAAAIREAWPEETGDSYTEADGPGMWQEIEPTHTEPPAVQMPKRIEAQPTELPGNPPAVAGAGTSPATNATPTTAAATPVTTTQAKPEKPDKPPIDEIPMPEIDDAVESELQAELVNIAAQIAALKRLPTTTDGVNFKLALMPPETDPNALLVDIIVNLSSMVIEDKLMQGLGNPEALHGVPLQTALDRAKRAAKVLNIGTVQT